MVIIVLSVILALSSALFLYIHHLTHQEFLLHLAAIPLEIMVGALIVDAYLGRRERARRFQQLSYIKGFLFRTEMKNLFVNNFRLLQNENLKLNYLKDCDEEELRKIRADFGELSYRSGADKDTIVDQYVGSVNVFRYFMEWSIHNDADGTFRSMIFLLHFVQDVKTFRELHPERSVADEGYDDDLRERVEKVLRDNVVSFLDYAIELRRDRPHEFEHLMEDYIATEARFHRQETMDRGAGAARLAVG
ncbi:MAG: hypothetical protein AB7O56_02855 [Bauldia sp.]